ncbi:GNAT family N-acetyltransferase [Paractinoplanes deccanensis]|uniref:GNAT family N-acetyltransferase n=1 Tax=Paractinoplanes deccanensis TaxID=113561 RepID=UPI001941A48F|nr:GNAT family N-acetyltransferase [Actinoplanes deccanensis]
MRPATAGDAYRLADIVLAATEDQGRLPAMSLEERAEWREGFAEWSRRTAELADPANALSVITAEKNAGTPDGEVIGRLRVVRDAGGLRLAGLQLVPEAQGRGIGTSIVRDLQERAAHEGVPLLLGVEKDNPRARRLYERLGFRKTGEANGEDLLRWPT